MPTPPSGISTQPSICASRLKAGKAADDPPRLTLSVQEHNVKRVPLIILGAGNVGRALVSQLLDAAPLHARRDGLTFSVVAWCDKSGAVIDEDGLQPVTLHEISEAKAAGKSLAGSPRGYRQDDPAAVIDVAGTDGCLAVDVTASDATVPALDLALGRGYGAVTANKLPLTGDQDRFDRWVSSRRFRYESTVGSAVPVIETARALIRAADRVDIVQGALSGTLGFLCTGLQAGEPLSLLVQEAMRLGYAEPDPRIDLSGQDVARKALILARTLDWKLDLRDVRLTSMVPPALVDLSVADFLSRLPELDAEFAERAAAAAAVGCVLRYVAELRGGRATVGLQTVPLDSPLGRLRGNDNLVAFSTRYYPDNPLVLQGRGAGVEAAAAGVHADLVAVAIAN
jgi:homoserine dehydrogenase